ncbi:MAG: tetratricopeptide repeat protein, partial [Candidatus Tectomicrobia bacterium]|nr:tetratricopeptide repeat protein [Candidatus Tectomicrobia bacterium]
MSIIHEALKKLERQGTQPDPFLPALRDSSNQAGDVRRGWNGRTWMLAVLLLLSFIGGGLWATLKPEQSPLPGEAMTASSPVVPPPQAVSPLTPPLSTPKGHPGYPGERVSEEDALLPSREKVGEGALPSRSRERVGERELSSPSTERGEKMVSPSGEKVESGTSASAGRTPGTGGQKAKARGGSGGIVSEAPQRVHVPTVAFSSPPKLKIPVLPKKEEGNVPEPGNAEEYFRRGVQLWKEKNVPEAAKAFEKTLELNPKLAEAANNLGNLYFEQNLFEKAI